MSHLSLRVAGAINVGLTLFHGLFPVLFHWSETLASLSPLNRALMFALAIHSTLVIGAFAFISLIHAEELVGTRLGRFLARFIALFYGVRIIEEWTLFASPLPMAIALSLLCAALSGAYLLSTPAPRPRLS